MELHRTVLFVREGTDALAGHEMAAVAEGYMTKAAGSGQTPPTMRPAL